MLQQFKKDNLTVQVFNNRSELGNNAAAMIAERMKALANEKTYINIVFAAAPSQNETLEALINDHSIQWEKINAFHMDEYIGLNADAPQLFGNFLKTRLFDRVAFNTVNYINGDDTTIEAACMRYSQLLNDNPPDIVCMGIGENTHLAFNDPHIADFNDPATVKTVSLDPACRQQQVNDGCFASLEEVPEYALTLTIPALVSVPYIFCMVPGKTKATAIVNTLTQPVNETYPSTILRKHPEAVLFIDEDSYSIYKNTIQ